MRNSSAQQHSDPGHAGDHLGRFVLAKPILDELLDVLDLLVEGHHPLGELGDQLSGWLLAGQGGGLRHGGLHGALGQGGGFEDLAGSQPGSSRVTPRRRISAVRW
jgi:hypothetical protein